MKVELDHEQVELELSLGERGGAQYNDHVYVYMFFPKEDLGCEAYLTQEAFDKMALAFAAAHNEVQQTDDV